MNRLLILFLALQTGSGLAASRALAEGDQITVETAVTWATPAAPEVHVLIRNGGNVPVAYSLWIGKVPGGSEVACASIAKGLVPDMLSRFHSWNGVSAGYPFVGKIDGGGWSHRSLILGVEGLIAPCVVPYKLVIHGDVVRPERTFDGRVEVGLSGAFERNEVDRQSLRTLASVERSQKYGDRVVVRLLVENRGTHSFVAMINRKTLRCEADASAGWAVRYGTVQGEDSGPIEISPGRWGVFVSVVELIDGKDLGSCVAEYYVDASTPTGSRSLARVAVPLRPGNETPR